MKVLSFQVGDVFMQRIQKMASHIPYMTAPGNHGMYKTSESNKFIPGCYILFFCCTIANLAKVS